MIGKVIGYNSNKGMAAVKTNNGITVFKILGGYDISLDDEIEGNLNTHAGEKLLNKTKNEVIEVFIEGIQCSTEVAEDMLK
jgi:hypothetical protein